MDKLFALHYRVWSPFTKFACSISFLYSPESFTRICISQASRFPAKHSCQRHINETAFPSAKKISENVICMLGRECRERVGSNAFISLWLAIQIFADVCMSNEILSIPRMRCAWLHLKFNMKLSEIQLAQNWINGEVLHMGNDFVSDDDSDGLFIFTCMRIADLAIRCEWVFLFMSSFWSNQDHRL